MQLRLILFFTVQLFLFKGFTQTIISGKIIDSKNNPLDNASIVVTKPNQIAILTYSISDENGSYALTINSTLDSLQISVSHLGYFKQTKIFVNKKQTFDFILLESSEKLKEVIVKTIPITKKGDTISYNVDSFKSQKDRVIADVLAKMPGIDVLPDGRILYQGKPINKYYIEGLDLLEGKYNLANNNLPASSVSKVQILENHQPVKLLDSLVFSDKAALNIRLKKNIAFTGVAELGLGLSPMIWDINITPMLFTKKQQMITSYQSNNVGNDISDEIKTFSIEDLIDQIESKSEKQNWVSIQQLPPPPFSKNRWLDNNAHLLTTNYLVRLKKEVDLKLNLSYINDFQQQIGTTQTRFFTPTDTISINENINNRLFFNSLKGKFVLTKNIKKNYFKNTFETNTYWDSQNGQIVLNNENINQNIEVPFTSLSNKLKWVQPFGKTLVSINSVFTYTSTPQNLKVLPGQFEDLINNGVPFDAFNQKIKHSNFYTDNSFSFTKGIKKFIFTPKFGFSIQNQQLNSRIYILDNNSENILTEKFQNNLIFKKSVFYGILNTQYRKNNWRFELNTPFKIQTFNRIDNQLGKEENLNRFTFEPKFKIIKDINAFWKATFSTGIKNKFGNINQLYYGYIINNYRNIQQYETPILESLSGNMNIALSYRNPIKSLFINGAYSFRKTNQNLIFGNIINSDGFSFYGFFEQENISSGHNINLRGSKYFSNLKTTLSITTNALLENREQLLNGVLTKTVIKNMQIKGEIDTEISDWMSVGLKSNFTVSNTQFENQNPFDNIFIQEHLLNLNFFPTSNQYIGFDAEYYKNNLSTQNQENYFLNINYRYSFDKSKIELELNWNNILNTKEFTTVFNDAFSYTQSTYILRPSQILASIKFNF